MKNTITNLLTSMFIQLVLLAAWPLLSANASPANGNEAVMAGLNFTRAHVEKHHLVAAVELRDRRGKLTRFQYDRVGEVERLRRDDGTFARKEGAAWTKSDDWAEHGSSVDNEEAEELEHLGEVVEGILKTKDEPGLRTWRIVEEEKGTRRHTFRASRTEGGPENYPRLTFEAAPDTKADEMLLQEVAGPIFVGSDVMVATIRLAYGSDLDRTGIPAPSLPSPSPVPAR